MTDQEKEIVNFYNLTVDTSKQYNTTKEIYIDYINGNRKVNKEGTYLYWQGVLSGIERALNSLGYHIEYDYKNQYKTIKEIVKNETRSKQEAV